MILAALRQLAIDEGLVASPAYEAKSVHFEVVVGDGGRFVSMRPLGDITARGWNGVMGPVPRPLPGTRKSGTTIDPSFLVGNSSFAFGRNAPADADVKSASPTELSRRRDAFRQLIDDALAALPDPDAGLAAVARFLAGSDAPTPDPRLRSNHLIRFVYEPDEFFPVHERDAVAAHWHQRLAPTEGESGEAFQCLVSGTSGPASRSHPVVQRVPGGNTTGVRLVSFNAPAFTSYGLEQSHNAPVSQPAADAYTEALRRLFNPNYPDPKHANKALDARSFRISEDTAVAFWAAGDQAAVSLVGAALTDPGQDEARRAAQAEAVARIVDPKVVEDAHRCTWQGRELTLSEADRRRFFTLTLSGAEARAVVRGWHETTLGLTLKHVRRYFQDIAIHRPAGDESKPTPLLQLLRQTAAQGKLENIPAALAGDVFLAVLTGRAFPHTVLEALVRRVRAERTLYPDRAAFLKAYLCRAKRLRRLPADFPEVKPMLDPDCDDNAYLLGRLFALLEKLQEDAVSAKASIRDRYYGAASATPVVVFPQLLRKVPHHVAKLEGGGKYLDIEVQKVCAKLRPPTPFPSTLTLERQGLFAVGYYHQRQSLFTKRDKAAEPAPEPTPES